MFVPRAKNDVYREGNKVYIKRLFSKCDPILEKVVKGEKRKMRLLKFQTKTYLNTV